MNLYDVIYQLVCENDCVIIPGFGGFVVNRFSANVDFSKQEFRPPCRKVAFNENLSLSDGLLFNYLSQSENISWTEAQSTVESFVGELNEQLLAGKTVSFDGLGDFSRRTGNLVFVSNSNNLLDESFGLTSFNFPMLHSAAKPRIESAIIKGTPDNAGKKKHRGRLVAWSLSSVAVIAGLVCLAFYMGWFGQMFGTANENTQMAGFGMGETAKVVVSSSESETFDENTAVIVENNVEPVSEEVVPEEIAEVVETVEEEPAEESVIEEPVAEAVVEETVVAVAESNTDYKVHIIAGCFANYSNAENVYKDLQSKGLSPQILPLHKGLYKVSVKGFASTAEACAELQSLKAQTGNDLLWVLKL